MLPRIRESIEQEGGKESNGYPQCQMECLKDAKWRDHLKKDKQLFNYKNNITRIHKNNKGT